MSALVRLRVHAGPLALWLGLAAVGFAVCLWFPTLFTSPEARGFYPPATIAVSARVLAVLACACGLVALATTPRRALVGLGLGLGALVAAATVRLVEARANIGVLGLDWLVVDGLVMVLVLVPLEAAWPHRPRSERRGVGADIGFFIVNHLAVRWLGGLGIIGAIAAGAHRDGPLTELPLVVQLLALLFVSDLVQYALHRAMHEVPWLWRLHAVHHASEHLDALAGSRIHLVESVITRSTIYLVALSLGISPVGFLVYGALIALQGSFIHANVHFHYGWLERVIVSPRYHHWHHASDPEAIDTNYAGTFAFIDRLFGTQHLPRDRWPRRYGVVPTVTTRALVVRSACRSSRDSTAW